MVRKKSLFLSVTRIVSLFVMGLIVAVVIALSQVNLETLRGNVLVILQNATGMPVEIDGAVSWKLSLRPRIELNQVRIPNAEWAHHKYAFSAEKIDVTLNLLSLFRSRPTIQNVKIYDASVCVEKNDNGELSITPFSGSPAPGDDDKSKPQDKYPFEDPGLGGVEVRNLIAHIFDDTYSVVGFNVRYVPRRDQREYAGWIKSNADVFPFIVSYSEYNPERKVYPVRVALSTGGDALIANIALEGKSRMPIDFIIKGDIPDIAALGDTVGVHLAEMPKMKVNLAGGFDRRKISLRKSSVQVRGMEINISGDYDWSGKIPQINLNLESDRIDLIEMFPGIYGRKWIRPKRDLNVFKDIPLFGDEFLKYNINLRSEILNLIVYRDLNIRDIDLSVKLKNAKARVDAGAVIAGGEIKIAADIDIENDGHMYGRAGAVARNVSVGNLLREIRIDDILSDLPVNIETYVEADGTNLSEVMQTITGPVRAYSTASGYAHSALVANMYGTDFLTSLRHSIQDLFRTDKKHNQIKISCAAVNTKLRHGRAETQQGVAVETNAINIRLAGSLDLGDENMRLALTTVPVRGLKLSLTGNVVNSIELTGNLAEPDIKINGAAVAGKVASATGIGLLLAPFTGGIGLVAGAGVGLLAGDLLENWLADGTPCKTAMERGAPARRDDPEWMDMPIESLLESIMNKK